MTHRVRALGGSSGTKAAWVQFTPFVHIQNRYSMREIEPFWYNNFMIKNGQYREDIEIGAKVNIVLKKDQGTGNLTQGVVARILTSSSQHPHGIKVMLENGDVGRVQEIL